MLVPVPPRTVRALGVALALAVGSTACANPEPLVEELPQAAPGQPAGTVVLPAGASDVARTVQRIQDAITAAGGTVTALVDHAADARGVGVEIPPNTVVIGGSPAAWQPLLRADQQAAAELPQRYLVRQDGTGAVTLTTNSAAYVAAVSGVVAPEARTALHDTTTAVARQALGADPPLGSPLIGVTPVNYLLTVPTDSPVPEAVDRLRRAAAAGAGRVDAVLDLSAGPGDGGPPLRPTSLVLVSTPEAEAPLLAAAPSIGLDLPLRFAVWRDAQDVTQIGYPDLRRIAVRHGIPVDDPNVARLTADADRIARAAAGAVD
ncbi:DUF302 domain-containing protein [Pseudonocardia nigra]|uniref:DUF302 domain-containing protein n=1 Tax=Pseudonocardia nigra TaxID=1921578 RepID=UPI001C5F9B1E|nr:DUF302 domain-containing protein [Pseudonocardia nigra]